MRFYQLVVLPDVTDGEGEDHDEWFTSLAAAKTRRAELIQVGGCGKQGPELGIWEVDLAELPTRKLILNLLNRSGYIKSVRRVVEDYVYKRGPDEEETE